MQKKEQKTNKQQQQPATPCHATAQKLIEQMWETGSDFLEMRNKCMYKVRVARPSRKNDELIASFHYLC